MRAANTARVLRPPIRVLDDATIAQIAAGEVIERPVSVVKELVENSLDAGASRVVVELTSGGKDTICVIDDGAGIARAELALAFARHATSKLGKDGDLFAIASLGFRGEGLASIAAAGDVELTSRTAGEQLGARIEAHGLHVGEPSPVAAPLGTKVVVRHLFALTPARRAFLKSDRAEFARVASFLSQIALGWPRVGFTLRHDGRDVWSLPPVDDPIDRLEVVFGRDARGALAGIDAAGSFDRERILGYASRPGHDRSNRNAQVFFVNGRLVRSAALSSAWLAGYGSFGMTGRYPFGVVIVQVPPEDVDVNVHPTKIEVRFANSQAVFDALRRAIARTMRATETARSIAMPSSSERGGAIDLQGRPNIDPSIGLEERDAQISFAPEPESVARVLGQIDRTFILVATEDQLLVVDQHAAHERIAFEDLLREPQARAPSAPLLFPTVVELTPNRAALLHEFEADLRAAGVVVEPFGDGSYRISALPGGYEKRRFDLGAVLDDLEADGAPREGVAHARRVLATIACHSVVRAGEPLSLQEQSSLYDRLQRCDDPHTCPHGRPTMLRLDGAALAKAFKRV